MIEFKNIEVQGLARSVRASNNAISAGEINTAKLFEPGDFERGSLLGKVEPGKGHDHFLSGITVFFDMKFNHYWLIEAQRYNWFNIISAQSAANSLMYITNRPDFNKMFNKYVETETIEKIKMYANAFNISVNNGEPSYEWFIRAMSNLPMGFEMWMSVSTNYLQLKTMYFQRRSSKLDEDWSVFIKMCEELPSFLDLIY